MIIVYDAANSLEAHVIKGVLEQHEIPAYIQGEHLQSGVGEIHSINSLVKISVENENYEAARKIIKEWEAAEPRLSTKEASSESQTNNHLFHFNLMHIIISFIIGAFCMHHYLKPSLHQIC